MIQNLLVNQKSNDQEVFYKLSFLFLLFAIDFNVTEWNTSIFGEAGSRLEIHRRGDYLSSVTLVESKPNLKFDKSNPSYSTRVKYRLFIRVFKYKTVRQ